MSVEAWSTHNTKVAAALNALGFPVRIQVSERAEGDNLVGQAKVQFSLYSPSLTHPALSIKTIVENWEKGLLSQQDPMHPFLIGLRACNAYEALGKMMRGESHRLVAICGGRCFHYQPGVENASLAMAAEVADLRDVSLVSALSVIGYPVIGIQGPLGEQTFRLPRYGHALLQPNGEWQTPDIGTMITRAVPGKLPLLLEQTDPAHPLVIGYNARHVHSQILSRIKTRRRILTIGPRVYTGRYSIASEYASNRVLDSVQRNLKLPVDPGAFQYVEENDEPSTSS